MTAMEFGAFPVVAQHCAAAPVVSAAAEGSPALEPQVKNRINLCGFCSIHGKESAASRAHTKACDFAIQCFCFSCAKLDFSNKARSEARTKRLATAGGIVRRRRSRRRD